MSATVRAETPADGDAAHAGGGREGASPGEPTRPAGGLAGGDGRAEAGEVVPYPTVAELKKIWKRRAAERTANRSRNAWRNAELVVSDVLRYYWYDPSKAVPAEKLQHGPAGGSGG